MKALLIAISSFIILAGAWTTLSRPIIKLSANSSLNEALHEIDELDLPRDQRERLRSQLQDGIRRNEGQRNSFSNHITRTSLILYTGGFISLLITLCIKRPRPPKNL